MSGKVLNASATMTCPHGGTIVATPTEAMVRVGGQPPLKMTDTFTVSGCPFQVPVGVGTVPCPCISVVWVSSSMMSRAGQIPPLNQNSVGLCIGPLGVQGTVQISNPGQMAVTSV